MKPNAKETLFELLRSREHEPMKPTIVSLVPAYTGIVENLVCEDGEDRLVISNFEESSEGLANISFVDYIEIEKLNELTYLLWLLNPDGSKVSDRKTLLLLEREFKNNEKLLKSLQETESYLKDQLKQTVKAAYNATADKIQIKMVKKRFEEELGE